jgi:hypothetical protein
MSDWFSAMKRRLQASGFRLQATGFRLQATALVLVLVLGFSFLPGEPKSHVRLR